MRDYAGNYGDVVRKYRRWVFLVANARVGYGDRGRRGYEGNKATSTCAKCPHGLTDSDGNLLPEYRGRTYESMPCATCALTHGGSVTGDNDRPNRTVSLDALPRNVEAPQLTPADRATTLRALALTMASDTLQAVCRLPQDDRELLARRVRGESFASIGDALGMTRQGASWRWEKLRGEWPALAEAFPKS